MSSLVTKETDRSVSVFIKNIGDTSKEKDSKLLLSIMKEITNKEPKVWGNNNVLDFIIGFGKYVYTRKGSNSELEWFKVGFTPRKNRLTIHLNFDLKYEENLLHELGRCKWGRGCLYINKLVDVNLDILIQLIDKSIYIQERIKKTYSN